MTDQFECPKATHEAFRAFQVRGEGMGTIREMLDAAYAVDVPGIVREEVREFFAWWQDPKNFGGINDTRTSRDYLTVYLGQRFGHPPATDPIERECERQIRAGLWPGASVGPSRGEPEAAFDSSRVFAASVRHAEPQPSTTNAVMPEMLPSCRACPCASCGAVRDFVQAMAEVYDTDYSAWPYDPQAVFTAAKAVVAARKVSQ